MDPALLQQAVMDGTDADMAYEPPTYSYDEVFPALPQLACTAQSNSNPLGQWNQKMRIGSSVITQVFHVPYEERKFDHNEKFGGEGDSMKPCADIMKETGANIEISSSKDHSLTFVVTGKQDAVLKARKAILTHFQTQASSVIPIPKEHHRYILGKSGAKLQELEKITATKITVPKTNDSSDKITITGPKEGIDKAVHEIRVISDEQSKQAYEWLEVPKTYHPFIAGAHNEKVNALIAETGVRINIPPLSVHKDEVTIAGEKEGVLKAKEAILKVYEEMKLKCATVSVEVKKTQHKHVIGPRGSTIAEILKETGVSVEMPPSDSSSETITLRGPQDKLGIALTKVYEKASSVTNKEVSAPSWIHKYIIGKKGSNIRQITQDLPKVHVEFTDNEDKIKIEGPPEEVEQVTKCLEEKIMELLKDLTFEEITVDPRFHKHIIGKSGANINRLKEETRANITIPDIDSSGIRIEGNRAGVLRAKQELEDMVHKLENEKEKDIIIDQRFHKNIIGAKGEKIREIRDRFNQVQITFPDIGLKRDVVKIRGPKPDVDECSKYLNKLTSDLLESSHQTQVPIYKQFHKFIIGKGGVNIRKIRDETNTKIDLPAEGSDSDVIKITGKKENVEDAKERILKIQNELSNIVQVDIMIPCKFHNSIIGVGGKMIQSIMEECGGVSIKFPPHESGSDKVTIRGPKEDVDKAKRTLLELSNERQLSSYTAEVKAKWEHHKFLIGRSGANIKKIRDATGARVVFPNESDENREVIMIMGKKDSVEKAKIELETMIRELDKVVEAEMTVDRKYHRHFVARRGEVLRQIAEQYGGVTVSFPRAGYNSDQVTLKGAKDCVEAAQQKILEIVQELEQMVSIECVIPQKFHRTVMGAKGTKVQGITSQFDVQIKFPDKDMQDHNEEELQMNGEMDVNETKRSDIIRITGKKENCDGAKQALLDLVPISIDVTVPFNYHRFVIGQKGKEVREMMEKYDVNIAVPPVDQKSDVIRVSGTPANVQQTKAALEELVQQWDEQQQDKIARSFELKIDVSPEYHPKIIGRKGAVITKIREEHDVQIQFPRKGESEENIITIVGYEKNANEAKDAILKIVNDIDDMMKEEVRIDHRVHARLIGQKGRNIRKIMDQFHVDIKFPRSTDSDPDIVTISGLEDNVLDAKDHLLNLEEEFMQDIRDEEEMRKYTRAPSKSSEQNKQPKAENKGFVVKGGPWEQTAPDTASAEDFPSFGESAVAPSGPVAWGPRR